MVVSVKSVDRTVHTCRNYQRRTPLCLVSLSSSKIHTKHQLDQTINTMSVRPTHHLAVCSEIRPLTVFSSLLWLVFVIRESRPPTHLLYIVHQQPSANVGTETKTCNWATGVRNTSIEILLSYCWLQTVKKYRFGDAVDGHWVALAVT